MSKNRIVNLNTDLLLGPRQSKVPSLPEVIECYQNYKNLRDVARIKPIRNWKRHLPDFIKTALQSNRFGEGPNIFLRTIVEEFGRLNNGRFPSPAVLHKEGVYELAVHSVAKLDVPIKDDDFNPNDIEDLHLDDSNLEVDSGKQ